MSKPISQDDRLSRVVCLVNRKSYCRVSKNEVKPKAFKPNKDGETSIFVTTDIEESEIWNLGEVHLCDVGNVYGRADLSATTVIEEEKINIDYNNEPEYHANLIWPDDKEDIQDIAQILAAEATCLER